MSDLHETTYLQQVLALDPRTEADVVLRHRRGFLRPTDVVVAELADDETDRSDLRTRLLRRLNAVRQAFWDLGADDLKQKLSSLQNAAHAETVAAAVRLQRVATHRGAIQRLSTEPGVHPAFVKALARILIAPAAEANRLREREHRCMRPERNPHYESAWSAIQDTVHLIRLKYPEVFELEQAWLTELIEYNPVEETEDESSNVLLGMAVLAGLVVSLVIVVCILSWIFS